MRQSQKANVIQDSINKSKISKSRKHTAPICLGQNASRIFHPILADHFWKTIEDQVLEREKNSSKIIGCYKLLGMFSWEKNLLEDMIIVLKYLKDCLCRRKITTIQSWSGRQDNKNGLKLQGSKFGWT